MSNHEFVKIDGGMIGIRYTPFWQSFDALDKAPELLPLDRQWILDLKQGDKVQTTYNSCKGAVNITQVMQEVTIKRVAQDSCCCTGVKVWLEEYEEALDSSWIF